MVACVRNTIRYCLGERQMLVGWPRRTRRVIPGPETSGSSSGTNGKAHRPIRITKSRRLHRNLSGTSLSSTGQILNGFRKVLSLCRKSPKKLKMHAWKQVYCRSKTFGAKITSTRNFQSRGGEKRRFCRAGPGLELFQVKLTDLVSGFETGDRASRTDHAPHDT